jgi:hypothetical protein
MRSLEKKKNKQRRRGMIGGIPDGEASEKYSEALSRWLREYKPNLDEGYLTVDEIADSFRDFGLALKEVGTPDKLISYADESVSLLSKHLQKPWIKNKVNSSKSDKAFKIHQENKKLMLDYGEVWIQEGFSQGKSNTEVVKKEVNKKETRVQSTSINFNNTKKENKDLQDADGFLTEAGEKFYDDTVFDYKPQKKAEPIKHVEGGIFDIVKSIVES